VGVLSFNIIRRTGVDDVEKYCPDALWRLVQPLLPAHPERHQGGGRRRIDDRVAVAAIAYVLQTGCAWEALPGSFPISRATAHRRFAEWVQQGVMEAFRQAVLDVLAAAGEIDWSRASVDAMPGRRRASRGRAVPVRRLDRLPPPRRPALPARSTSSSSRSAAGTTPNTATRPGTSACYGPTTYDTRSPSRSPRPPAATSTNSHDASATNPSATSTVTPTRPRTSPPATSSRCDHRRLDLATCPLPAPRVLRRAAATAFLGAFSNTRCLDSTTGLAVRDRRCGGGGASGAHPLWITVGGWTRSPMPRRHG
jgi:transposase